VAVEVELVLLPCFSVAAAVDLRQSFSFFFKCDILWDEFASLWVLFGCLNKQKHAFCNYN